MKKSKKITEKLKNGEQDARRFVLGSVFNHIKKSWVEIKTAAKRATGFTAKGL